MGGGWRYPTPEHPAPRPSQQRAADTIRYAIEATADLLTRLPEDQVTLEAIRRRSGISQGSITHHFGSRSALVAAAQFERHQRSCAADEAFLSQLAGSVASPSDAVTVLLGMMAEIVTEPRRTVRWVRLSTVAAAFDDPGLTSALSVSFTRLVDGAAALAEDGRLHATLRSDVDARAAALLMTMHAQGLVVDDLAAIDVPTGAWQHVLVRFLSTLLGDDVAATLAQQELERFGDVWRAEVFGPPGRVPADVAGRLRAARARAGVDDDVTATTDRDRNGELIARTVIPDAPAEPHGDTVRGRAAARVRTAATRQLRDHGARGVDVEALRDEVDLSPQAFHRLFGGRDQLVRDARVRLEIARQAHAASRFARMVRDARASEDLQVALADGAPWTGQDGRQRAVWQRAETLAAASADPELRDLLARTLTLGRDLLTEQVALAQERGLIDRQLEPRSLARFLDGTAFWWLFLGLDTARPTTEGWGRTLRRIATMIAPGGP